MVASTTAGTAGKNGAEHGSCAEQDCMPCKGRSRPRRTLSSCTAATCSEGSAPPRAAARRTAYTSQREGCCSLRGLPAQRMQQSSRERGACCCWPPPSLLPLMIWPPAAAEASCCGSTKAAAKCRGRTPCSGGGGRSGHAGTESSTPAAAGGSACPGAGLTARDTSPRPLETSSRPPVLLSRLPAVCTSTTEAGRLPAVRPAGGVSCCAAGSPAGGSTGMCSHTANTVQFQMV